MFQTILLDKRILPKKIKKNKKINLSYLNLFLCIKYRNSGKLSSHNWFFNGFCNELKPKYSFLIDVGLKPSEKSIVKMYEKLKSNPQIGGVCGFMKIKLEKMT
jgi:chitin synthase